LCVLKIRMAESKDQSMSQKVALICGVSGQDGSYLAALLLSKGYSVFGTSRDVQGSGFSNLHQLGIQERVQYISMVPEDFRNVLVALRKSKPDEIYYLAGQSSVGLSFEQPAETIQSITLGTLNMLEGCRMMDKQIKLYHAGSGERFVTQKIIRAVKRIAQGNNEKLKLGRLDIARDWGWAPEYIDVIWRMLQQDQAQDYVIAAGIAMTLEEFVNTAFDEANLNWHDYVIQDPSLFRPTDLAIGRADPSKAEKMLHWKASTCGIDVVKKMYQSI
jgi:GDPmannose 4,6-dehydratase